MKINPPVIKYNTEPSLSKAIYKIQALVGYEKNLNPSDLALFQRLLENQRTHPDILLLGDSVFGRISDSDKDKRSLCELILDNLKNCTRGVCFYRGGYHIKVFHALVNLLGMVQYKPKIVVLPINLRSFSPQWDFHPSWQHERDINTINRFISNPKGIIKNGDPSSDIRDSLDYYKNIRVQYPGTSFTRIGEFIKVLESHPQTEAEKNERLRLIFIFHYMHLLKHDHPKILLLEETLVRIKNQGIKCLIYITPVNYQAGIRFVGESFYQVLEENIKVVNHIVHSIHQNGDIIFRSWGDLFPDEFFVHKNIANEHLNQKGRKALSNKIYELIGNYNNTLEDELC